MTAKHNTGINTQTVHASEVPVLRRELHLQLQRYIEAQYPIRHASVVTERQKLLETPGVISQEPFIESVPGYTEGPTYHSLALPSFLTEAFEDVASSALIPHRPYLHQAEALEAFLTHARDLIVVTGTGSGKTETFLLPIFARCIEEARSRSQSFHRPGMRTLLLYPMNALVNDQLTRLRRLFGHPQLVSWFRQRYRAERSVRFGMYTSRTPYPGVMSEEKNRQQLLPLLDYYLQLEQEQPDQSRKLKEHGRWPALDLTTLRAAAQIGKTAVSSNDYELYTRHQMQQWCPDILITNYSMLEYMLMRLIERSIFQQTADWLAQDRDNTLLIVLDEAHLYNGVTGAEISLLLRRLQARLGITRERVRYILTSASLDTGDEGQEAILDFAKKLVGAPVFPHSSFALIQGQRIDAPPPVPGSDISPDIEAEALSTFDIHAFTYRATEPTEGQASLALLTKQLGWSSFLPDEHLSHYLGQHLPRLQTFLELWRMTSGHAIGFQRLAQHLFPTLDELARGRAASALLALAAVATTDDGRILLPVRAHLFFRGLPPIYACINPDCNARRFIDGSSEIGRLWLSPRLHCTCGARVYELYGHRNCGAIFLRAYAPNEPSDFYWHESGDRGVAEEDYKTKTLLLIGQPHPKEQDAEAVFLHIMTGRVLQRLLRPSQQREEVQEQDTILVYRPAKAATTKGKKRGQEEVENEVNTSVSRDWTTCPVCRKRLRENSLTSLSTKGEQPFVNLVRRQFELQQPSAVATDEAPNMGRKVLLFSDGRQRAARLALNLPREVELDTFRQALLLAAFRRGQRTGQPLVRMDTNLYRDFVAICAQYRLHFFDGASQTDLLGQIHTLREDYDLDVALAEDDGWEPPILQGYRLALLRQVADRFYSMQRMCAAVVEPIPNSLRLLKRKPIFARLEESDLHALVLHWIETVLDKSAFDASISPFDRQNTVPGEGFVLASTSAKTEGWNDAEKAAETLLGYAKSELQQLRTSFLEEFCETKEGTAFLRPEKLALRLTLEDSWYQCVDCGYLFWLPLGNRCPNTRCGSERLIQLPGNDPSLRTRTDFYREPIRQVVEDKRSPIHLTAEEHTAQLSYRDIQQISTTTEQYELRFQDIGISAERPAIDVLSCTTTMEVGVDIGALLGIGMRTMPPRRANYQQRAGRAGRRSAALSTVLAYSENGSHDAHYFTHPDEMVSGTLPCPQLSKMNQRLVRRHIQAALIQTFFIEEVRMSGALSSRQFSYLAEALGTAQTFFASSTLYGLTGFERWLSKLLNGSTPLLGQRIAAWIPDTFADGIMNEQQKREFVHTVANSFITDLRHLGEQLFPKNVTGANKDQNNQFGSSAEESLLLDLLFEHGFLPTYAFPREVRSFVIEEWKQSRNGTRRIGIKQRPQQSIDVALSEYAPGRELVVDKETYRVGGIYVEPFPGMPPANRVSSVFKRRRNTFALCFHCGYTHQEPSSITTNPPNEQCPVCQAPLVIEEILDPPGFAPERGKSLEPGKIREDGSVQSGTVTQVQLVLPLTDADDFGQITAGRHVLWSYAEHRELLIANCGVDGNGFSICRSCGVTAPGNPSWLHKDHERPFLVPTWISTSGKCNGLEGIWHGYLGHTFHSDLLLIRFLWPISVNYQVGERWMRDALDTIAQALLLAATRLLDIAASELQVGWNYTIAAPGSPPPPRMADFFLFDTLSGGAGYATQVGQHIDTLLSQAQYILDTCPEQCERSCYRCLRTYTNRIIHQRLDRRLAGTLLRAIVSGKAPDTLPLAQQAQQLDLLRQFLELTGGGVECQRESVQHGISVPLLLRTSQGSSAIGVYPVQQNRQVIQHPLDALPKSQVQLFSDYELMHNLPNIAQLLL